jgi:hypothetical protein
MSDTGKYRKFRAQQKTENAVVETGPDDRRKTPATAGSEGGVAERSSAAEAPAETPPSAAAE